MIPALALSVLTTVSSPDGRNAITIASQGEQLVYSIARDGVERLAPEPLLLSIQGISLPPIKEATIEPFSQTFDAKTPFYTVRSRIHLEGNGAKISLGVLTLTALATNQGIAYRWETALDGTQTILNETFSLRPMGEPDLLYAYNNRPYHGDLFQNSWESIHQRGKIDSVDSKRLIYLPITLLWKDAAIALSEAELKDYPGLNLRRSQENKTCLTGSFAQYPLKEDGRDRRYSRVTQRADWLVQTPGNRTYPWRIFMMAENPAGLYGNDLITALSEPATGDFMWVKPGQVSWEWWSRWGLDNVPFKPGVNTATYKVFIDFAATYNIPYILMDEGWAQKLDVTRIVPEINLPELLAYAKGKGVRLLLWCTWQQLIGRQDEIFKRYAAMGVAGFKIDFIDRDDARVANFLYNTAAIAAKHHLVLLFHGIHKPTGLSRTFPNVLAYEGVYGLEQTGWAGNQVDYITNDLRITFTRLLAGPMDYTPGAMRNAPRSQFRATTRRPMSMGTRCRQAALALLFDTNSRMLCDSASAYMREPEYTRLLTRVPLTFDDTWCAPDSAPDSRVLVLRRKGETIWIAGMSGNKEEIFSVPLDRLPKGVVYHAELVRDSPISDCVGTDYIQEERTVSSTDKLNIRCSPGGGFLMCLTPKQ